MECKGKLKIIKFELIWNEGNLKMKVQSYKLLINNNIILNNKINMKVN